MERTSVLDFVGAASSRDPFNSRREAAPTGILFSNLDLPDKRIKYLRCEPTLSLLFPAVSVRERDTVYPCTPGRLRD